MFGGRDYEEHDNPEVQKVIDSFRAAFEERIEEDKKLHQIGLMEAETIRACPNTVRLAAHVYESEDGFEYGTGLYTTHDGDERMQDSQCYMVLYQVRHNGKGLYTESWIGCRDAMKDALGKYRQYLDILDYVSENKQNPVIIPLMPEEEK